MGNEKCPLLESLLSNFRQSITSFFLHFGISGKRLHDRATIVASVSGLTAIVNSMAAHPNVAGVQEEACHALEELTDCSAEANLPELPRFQTEPLLEAAKKKFPNECAVSATRILVRLSS